MSAAIVRVSRANAALLDRVADDVFDEPIRPAWLTAFLDDPRHVMFVAVADGAVVGMTTGFEYFHPDKPPQLFINEVGVAPSHQRRGLGRRLTEALIEEARRRGCVYAWLGTATDNAPAQACFASIPDGAAPQSFLLYEWDLED
jgi:ribosomal protein S18 acetylase RimI-like enzyme